MKQRMYQFLAAAVMALFLNPCSLTALDMGVSYAILATPDEGYIEINLEIAPESIFWEKVDSSGFRASVDMLVLIKNGDAIIAYDKYVLNSPLLEYPKILLDLKRFALANGEYDLEITATDHLDSTSTDTYQSHFLVNADKVLRLSEITLLRSFAKDSAGTEGPFVKNGFFMEPLPFSFYDRSCSKMAFYAEVYHTNTKITDPSYQVRYIVEKDLGNKQTQLVSVGNLKKRPTVIDGILVQIDIPQLESGNYLLSLEVRNKQNELLASQKIDFIRSNPYLNASADNLTTEVLAHQFVQQLNEDELRYSLRAISPRVRLGTEPEELKNILKSGSLDNMRFFLFKYFIREDANHPETAWRAYMETANAVDKKFTSGFRYGFETDRGRTFMKYGRPDDMITVTDDPAAPPYEIWVYYHFPQTNQRNVKFLFYNPSLAGEDYLMLHSTARGEINNPKWEVALYKRNAGNEYSGDNYHDADTMQGNINRRARQYFEDF